MTEVASTAVAAPQDFKFFQRLLEDETALGFVAKTSKAWYDNYKEAFPLNTLSAAATPIVNHVATYEVTKKVDGFACSQLEHVAEASKRCRSVYDGAVVKITEPVEKAVASYDSKKQGVKEAVESYKSRFPVVENAWKDPVGETLSFVEGVLGNDDEEESEFPPSPAIKTVSFRVSKISKRLQRNAFSGIQNASFRTRDALQEMVPVSLIDYAKENFNKANSTSHDVFGKVQLTAHNTTVAVRGSAQKAIDLAIPTAHHAITVVQTTLQPLQQKLTPYFAPLSPYIDPVKRIVAPWTHIAASTTISVLFYLGLTVPGAPESAPEGDANSELAQVAQEEKGEDFVDAPTAIEEDDEEDAPSGDDKEEEQEASVDSL